MIDALKYIIIDYPHMTVRQLLALLLMKTRNNIKSCELAASMKVNRCAVTRMWDTLDRYGMIKRKRGVADERDMNGSLTAKGMKFCDEINNLMEE